MSRQDVAASSSLTDDVEVYAINRLSAALCTCQVAEKGNKNFSV